MKTPSRAPRPQAATSAAGVARPESARARDDQDGQRGADRSPGGGARQQPARQGEGGAGQDDGDEHAADPVRRPLDARLLRLGLLDHRLSSRDSCVSLPAGSARTTSRPVSATVPPVTLSPTAASAGTDSPVIMLRSTALWPNSTSPSAAMVSPGRTTSMSPGRSRLAGHLPLGSVGAEHGHVPGGRCCQAAHGLAGDAPGPRLIQPARQQERGDGGGGLQVDAAAGAVGELLPERSAAAARSRANMA